MFKDNLIKNIRENGSNVAIYSDDNVVTYSELYSLICKTSMLLLENLNKENEVMLLMDRSSSMIVSMITMYLMDIPYVPISTEYPINRIKKISDSLKSPMILTDTNNYSNTLNMINNKTIVNFDDIDYIRSQSIVDGNFENDLAYIIFTSGSTGKPKGVEIKKSSVEFFINWIENNYSKEEMKTVFSGTQITFDISVFEIFGTLNSGGTIVLGENDLDLKKYIQVGITLLNMVPSAFNELLESELLPSTLKTVNLAGESLSINLAKKFLNKFNKTNLYNLYGPTENTTYSTSYKVNLSELYESVDIPIGKSISGDDIYIYNEKSGFTKNENITGEIILSGPLLSKGYLNDFTRTKDKFLNLFDNEIKRIYKTGDLGYFDKFKNLHYIGRIDDQIKYHGFRIELSEISNIALSNKEVSNSIALIVDDNIYLFVSLYKSYNSSNDKLLNELNDKLKKSLPLYMIPKKIIYITQWPKNNNGKIDKKQLLNIYSKNNDENISDNFKHQSIENFLVKIWSKNSSLSTKNIDYDSNFFTIGGNSLGAMKIVSAINKRFKLNINIADIFKNNTINKIKNIINMRLEYNNNIEEKTKLNDFQSRMVYQYLLNSSNDSYMVRAKIHFNNNIKLDDINNAIHKVIKDNFILKSGVDIDPKGDFEFIKNKYPTDSFNISYEVIKNINPFKNHLISFSLVNKNEILVNASHLIIDGYSLNQFINEFINELSKESL